MEIRVRERLVGALVLVGIVVLLVPAILTGGLDRAPQAEPSVTTQSVEIRIADDTPATETDVLMPEPAQASTGADTSAVSAPEPQAAEPAPAIEPLRGPEPAAAETAAAPEPHPAAAAAATGPVPEQPAWAVQLGAFSTRQKAESLVADLRARGYSAFVLEYRASGRVLHRVRVGPEQDRARALAVAERLRKDGYPTVVAPHP